MSNALFKAIEGKAPLVCIKELYAVLYVVANSTTKDGLLLDIVVDTLNVLQEHMIKTLRDNNK